MTLDECRQAIGAGVVYEPKHGPRQDGVITAVSRQYVFVRYRGDDHSMATRPQDLTLATVGGVS